MENLIASLSQVKKFGRAEMTVRESDNFLTRISCAETKVSESVNFVFNGNAEQRKNEYAKLN